MLPKANAAAIASLRDFFTARLRIEHPSDVPQRSQSQVIPRLA